MAIKTQTMQVYYSKPGSPATVKEVGELTNIKGIDAAISAVDSTTLASAHREYTPGIAEPGSASLTINFDPKDAGQTDLHALRNAGTVLNWAVGYSDGNVAPVLEDGSAEFDDTALARSFSYFKGFMTSFAIGAEVNGVVSVDVGIQLVNIPELVVAA